MSVTWMNMFLILWVFVFIERINGSEELGQPQQETKLSSSTSGSNQLSCPCQPIPEFPFQNVSDYFFKYQGYLYKPSEYNTTQIPVTSRISSNCLSYTISCNFGTDGGITVFEVLYQFYIRTQGEFILPSKLRCDKTTNQWVYNQEPNVTVHAFCLPKRSN